MSNPNSNPARSGPDILASYVEEVEQAKLEDQWSAETLAARQAVMDLPPGHGGPTGQSDPALADLSVDQLKQRLADQLKAAHPEAYGPGWRPSHEDVEREWRLREAK